MLLRHAAALLMISLICPGCFMIADPNRKVVATFEGEPIRREDLKQVIREMPDDERPLIQSREVLLDTLNDYLNTRIKAAEARILRIDDKLEVDREQARQIYMAKHPEYRTIENATDPTGIGISKSDLIALQADMEFGIDEEMQKLYQEAALEYRTQEYIEAERPKITDEEFEAEYERSKESLKTFEVIDFIGIRFPVAPGAQQEAVKARKRIDDGESFDNVLESYLEINPNFGVRAAFENNPAKTQFVQFWYRVTGAKQGDILGPVYLPEHDQVRETADGQLQSVRQPNAYVVLQVIESIPARTKTLEEAKPDLAVPILRDRVMEQLRAEYGVEVFPDELWRPEGYGDQYKNSMIKTSVEE